ncbi:MAG: cobalt ECF transporter T component CbiQ [Ignavibacteria bacterium]|nr:cobalt ECF transporter T component CbiQ [Ignavibacteria bacterium]
MQTNFLDRYSRLQSPLHRSPASWKLLAALTLVIVTVGVPRPSWLQFAFTAVLLIVIALISTIPLWFLLKRLILLEPFVLGVAILTLFRPGGVEVFVLILVKSTLCLFTMILLSNSTPFSELLAVLRRLHVPAVLITTLALMYRYLFVLIDEAERMKRARLSRTFAPQRARTWISLATVIGQLFVRSTERAERIFQAMTARGWK